MNTAEKYQAIICYKKMTSIIGRVEIMPEPVMEGGSLMLSLQIITIIKKGDPDFKEAWERRVFFRKEPSLKVVAYNFADAVDLLYQLIEKNYG